MKQIKYIAFVILAAFGTAGCSDFLQKDPPSSPSQAVFWKSKEDFNYAMISAYSVMYNYSGVLSQIIATMDGLTDNSYTQHNETTYGRTQTMQQGDITPSQDGYPLQLYQLCYQAIGRVHQIMFQLENYTGSDISDDDRKFIMAQCKALRGYFYHWLYLCYREVPLVTELLTLENQYQPKATRDAIRTQIFKDFDEAIADLPDLPYSDSKVTGRLTPSALKVFKARVMIFDAYGETGVADPAKIGAVIPMLESIDGYSLAPTMRENFVSSEQLESPELIFSVRYLAPNRRNSMDVFYGGWSTLTPTRDFVDEFECTDGQEWGTSPLTVAVDETLINSKDGDVLDAQRAERAKLFENRDRRLRETVTHSNLLIFPEEEYAPLDQGSGNYPRTGFRMIKLVQPRTTNPDGGVQSDADVVITRYAHVLLMIAEAENEANGPTTKAYGAINRVRVRSGQPELPAGLSQEEMRARIRKEWRVETAYEGIRYIQMKQWRLMESLNTFTDPFNTGAKMVFQPAFYFWPLPKGEIDKAAGVLVQDPNY